MKVILKRLALADFLNFNFILLQVLLTIHLMRKSLRCVKCFMNNTSLSFFEKVELKQEKIDWKFQSLCHKFIFFLLNRFLSIEVADHCFHFIGLMSSRVFENFFFSDLLPRKIIWTGPKQNINKLFFSLLGLILLV